jgi:hypothetical protein
MGFARTGLPGVRRDPVRPKAQHIRCRRFARCGLAFRARALRLERLRVPAAERQS